jgi:hypothetical protein
VDQQVSIVLKSGDRYDIHLSAAELKEFDSSTGRFFVGEMFAAAGLETPNPVGKILLIDQILLLALEQKPEVWAQPDPALKRFLAAAVKALGRNAITIDLLNYKV